MHTTTSATVVGRGILLVVSMAAMGCGHAVEGGLGRSITGTQVSNFAGLVPDEPGLSVALGYAYYSGDIGTQRELPISGVAALGMNAAFDLYSVTGIYVWNSGPGKWNLGSMVTVPFANVDVSAAVDLGPVRRDVSDRVKGDLYDVTFVPVMAGYHFNEARHLSLALYVSAPTGDYDPARLANASLNVWVFSPTLGYTHLLQTGTLEWSTTAGVDLSTRNDDTDYKSGAVLHVDTLLVKSFANGWGVGGVGGWIEQLEDDSGPLADRVGGFRGSALALGPIITFQRKWGDSTVAISARWLREFEVKRRLKGDPLMLTASLTF